VACALPAGRATGFGGFDGFFFAAGPLRAGFLDAAFACGGRGAAFLPGRFRAPAAVFFPCTFAIAILFPRKDEK
jgi:hypothetical protein